MSDFLNKWSLRGLILIQLSLKLKLLPSALYVFATENGPRSHLDRIPVEKMLGKLRSGLHSTVVSLQLSVAGERGKHFFGRAEILWPMQDVKAATHARS